MHGQGVQLLRCKLVRQRVQLLERHSASRLHAVHMRLHGLCCLYKRSCV